MDIFWMFTILPMFFEHVHPLLSGVFPAFLKTAKVIPIHKKNSKLEVSNYRPASLLSNIDKLFEKRNKIVETKLSITDSLGSQKIRQQTM